MKGPFLALALIVGAPLSLHLADASSRAAALEKFQSSSSGDLSPILSYDPGLGATCPLEHGGDPEALVRALIAAESFATPRIERWWKDASVRALAAFDLRPPDWTYGPGRMRLSTASFALRSNTKVGTAPGSEAALGMRLLDYCEAKRIVSLLVSNILGPQVRERPIDLRAVRRIAAVYNGQSSPRTPEAAVAYETYNALVFCLFQHFRFRGLRSR